MKRIICVLLFLIFPLYASAFEDNFTSLNNWVYTDTDRYWPVRPAITEQGMRLTYAGTRTSANQAIRTDFTTVEVANVNNLTVETEFIFSGALPTAEQFPQLSGTSFCGQIGLIDGVSSYFVKVNSVTYNIGEIKLNTEYRVKAALSFKRSVMSVSLENIDSGDVKTASDIPCSATGTTVSRLIFYGYTADAAKIPVADIHRVAVYDDIFTFESSDITNGQSNVRTDTGLSLTFSKDVNPESAANDIKITDSEGNAAYFTASKSFENSKKLNIYFTAGLLYNTAYKVSVTGNFKSADGMGAETAEINFQTEQMPFGYFTPRIENTADKSTAKVDVINLTGENKKISILLVVYKDNAVKKAVCREYTVSGNTDYKELTVDAVLPPGLTGYTSKAFVFGEFVKMDNIPVLK